MSAKKAEEKVLFMLVSCSAAFYFCLSDQTEWITSEMTWGEISTGPSTRHSDL